MATQAQQQRKANALRIAKDDFALNEADALLAVMRTFTIGESVEMDQSTDEFRATHGTMRGVSNAVEFLTEITSVNRLSEPARAALIFKLRHLADRLEKIDRVHDADAESF